MTAVYRRENELPRLLSLSLRSAIDINYRCSVQRSDPHFQQMERISDISERNRLRAVALSSAPDLLLSVFSFSRICPWNREEELSHIGMEERLFLRFSLFASLSLSLFFPFLPLFLSYSVSLCLSSISLSRFSFTPLFVALASSHVWPRYHLSFCQLGDFNLLSFCAITGPRGPRKIVFNCD